MAHPPTLATFAQWLAGRYGATPAMRFKRDGAWQEISFEDLSRRVPETARKLRNLGVNPGDRVALMADTCPEWTICDLAIAAAEAVCVPVYPTNSASECAWVLGDSGARLAVCGNDEQRSRVGDVPAAMLDALTAPEITATSDISEMSPKTGSGNGSAGGDDGTASEVDPDAVNTIIYTSGTTGPPKGCLITHANWWQTLEAITSVSSMGPGSTMYVYLPLAHMFARTVQLATLLSGATLVYWGGDLARIVDELAEIQPTQIPSVPRLFEKAYARVASMLDEDQLSQFGPAIVQQIFGGRVVEALTGGAPIAKDILEFFGLCGVPIYEAYGLTESTALITSNVPGAAKFGTVGRPLKGIEARIAEDGEVLTRGPHVFAGYHNNPQATAETIQDGWLHTGDLGELDEDGYLTITGRKKDLIITSGGKNLSPANMENDLRQCRWVSQAVMYGDRRPYAVALITLDREELERAGITPADARTQVDAHVKQVNENYAPPERVRRHLILDEDFTDVTPSLKVRRQAVFERYSHLLESLYHDHGQVTWPSGLHP